jgi:hypothetical protein
MVVRFHISRFLKPKPPSSLSKKTVSQAAFALPKERSVPFHKKDLNKEVIFAITALERIKREDQYT